MRLELVSVGDTREGWLKTGEAHYIKKCRRYGKLEVRYLKSGKAKTPAEGRRNDSKKIMEYIDKQPKRFDILLDERGEMMDSTQFATQLEFISMHHGGDVRFIIGGPFGVTEDLRERCNRILSLSPMVFTHEMIRVILLEQVYRAFTILRGESYHHY